MFACFAFRRRFRRSFRLAILTLVFTLVMGLVAAAFPQPSFAATCVTYYTIKPGDTTVKIARTFGLKWKQIAIANNITQWEKLEIGKTLCIPPKESPTEVPRPGTTAVTPRTKMTASLSGDRLRVTLGGLSLKGVYTVKVRESTVSAGGWYKIGRLKIDKNETVIGFYQLPRELVDDPSVRVCLKNGTTDEVICQNVFNIR